MKLKICLVGLFCLFFKVIALAQTNTHTLKVGDLVSDITIKNIIGYPNERKKLSDLKGKLVLLDFWATWCSSCIVKFPENYALQKKFRDKFLVLLVNSKSTHDTERSIKNFLDRRVAQYYFPCIVEDTLLTSLFPHQTLPHCVLIKDNRVVAITDAEHITEENISALISGRDQSIFVKKDKKFDLRQPLFINGNGGAQQPFIFRTLLLPRIENLTSVSGFIPAPNHRVSAIRIYNGLLTSLYKFAYREYSNFEHDRTIFKIVKGHNDLLDSAANVGFDKVQFTYESNFSPRPFAESLKVLQADLDSYFNLKVDSEYRDTLCYVIKLQAGGTLPGCDKGQTAETNIYENSGATIYFTNLPFSDLTSALEGVYQVPFINETGGNKEICLQLPANLLDREKLTKSLLNQGLILIKERRKLSYFVLSDKAFAARPN
ncbi:TlpA family protein disulfide reductase [Mucilaginibacter sp. UYCu711]|uniref:TlpA family protein disulfide reductase n=1 Tax=Mucilaginibacter sp. UYCu711 TaxID=3156339 RepID=UPI003D1D941E